MDVSRGITQSRAIFEQVQSSSSPKFFLDIFAGATMPVSMALTPLFCDRVQPIDLIHGHDLLDDDIFESVLHLAASGLIGAALAAPYCSKHSRATLRPDGPAPVRTPEFINGLPSNSPMQQLAVEESAAIHDRSRILLSEVDKRGGLAILENPATSMTWDDDLMAQWVQMVTPFAAQAYACQFGRDWAKAWMFVANRPDIFAVAKSCPHDAHVHQQIAGVRMADGSFLSRITAEYPPDLAQALASIIAPYVTKGSMELKLNDWQSALPATLKWPTLPVRVEDGGGLPSTASHMQSPAPDRLAAFRSRWFKRLCDTKHCFRITAALTSGCKQPPLSDLEVQPYIDDMLDVLGCPPGDHLLAIPAGQPFRLYLWHQLATFLKDPDADFLLELVHGVPLGVNEPLTPSPAWKSHEGTVLDPEPLLLWQDSWKSALDHQAIVEELVQEELDAGFIALVPGGTAELQKQYSRTAVGKLGVVIAEGRSPRLVVDSSVSNVTANTVIPNHMTLPRISDVMDCAPANMAKQQMIQLTLDVSKAHRRILISSQDGGMLCFHANGRLYRCITLNFGARASGWYWGRVAGLMVRTSHALLSHGHALWQYVDDLLAWLDRTSSPLWASLLVILFLILGIPMSWHKAALDVEIDWIGWRISVLTWSISIPAEKLNKILKQVRKLAEGTKVPLKELQSIIGRLLWLTSGWHFLRPLLIPLYRTLNHVPTTMVGMDHVTFQQLLDALSPQMVLTQDLTHLHQSLGQQTKLVRVANTHVQTLSQTQQIYIKSRRVWIGIQDPMSPTRLMDDESHVTLRLWEKLLVSTPFSLSMSPAAYLQVTATADAMASSSLAGFGGAAFFPDSSCVWFQFQITLEQAQAQWDWVGADMQKHIAAWELLAQFALTVCIESHLPRCRGPVACSQGTDNSAADASSSKGLSMTPAVAAVLAPYFKFMRRYHVFPKMTHVPGHLNIVADSLSRFKQPLPDPLTVHNHCAVRWQELLASSPVGIIQTGRKWPSKFGIDAKSCISPLTGGSLNRFSCWGVSFTSGWSIFDFLWCLCQLPTLFHQPDCCPALGYVCLV